MGVPNRGETFRFKREEHLKKRNDIGEVFKSGKQYGCRGAKLFVLRNDLPYNRICFTFSRGFGNAVQRNHAKRLGREAFRLLKAKLSAGSDIILLIYPDKKNAGLSKVPEEKLSDRLSQLQFLFSKAGLLI
jgi:ribonuclease P protein component